MILVDSSIWVDHFRSRDQALSRMLEESRILCHPFVVGEIMMGNPTNRIGLAQLRRLPEADRATDHEVVDLVERYALFGMGVGYVDAHLLASVALTPDSALWTRDRRMTSAAGRLNLIARDFSSLS